MVGPIDPYLLSSLGTLDGTDLRVSAMCAGTMEAISDDLLIVLHGAGHEIVVRAMSGMQLAGPPLAPDALLAVAEFVEQHRMALIEHWLGRFDSMMLARMIKR